MAARAPMMSLRPARRFDWSNLRVRVASAAVLLPAVGLAVIVGHWVVLLLVAVAVALLAVEWAQMSAPATPIRNAVVVTLGVLLALFIGYRLGFRFSWPVLAVGAAGAALAVRGSAISPARWISRRNRLPCSANQSCLHPASRRRLAGGSVGFGPG